MSRLSPSLRPIMLFDNHSSTSLEGMEIATRRSSIRTDFSWETESYHKAKPLPSTLNLRVPSPGSSRASSTFSSRRPSFSSSRTHSITSSTYTEDITPPPKYLAFRKGISSPSTGLEPDAIKDQSSTLEVPDALLSGPQTTREANYQPVSHKSAKTRKGPPESLFSEWKPPRYRDSDDDDEGRAGVPAKAFVKHSGETQHIAEQHANDYMSILARASTMPSSDHESYYEGYNSLPTPVSAKVADVVDETLVPRPLRKSAALDSSTSSHFSDSSGYMALKEEYRDSFKSRAKKAFHLDTNSQDHIVKKGIDSHTSSMTLNTGERSQAMSITPSEQASIQRGVIDMYDSSTSVYDPLEQHTPPPEAKARIEIAQDIQSAAVPMIPCEESDLKAWNTASPPQSPLTMSAHESWFSASPTGSTPRKSHFSQSSKESSSKESQSPLPLADRKKKMKAYRPPHIEIRPKGDRSVSGKIKKVVGLESKKHKQTEDEKRREDMKKKIVIVEAIEQGPFLVDR